MPHPDSHPLRIPPRHPLLGPSACVRLLSLAAASLPVLLLAACAGSLLPGGGAGGLPASEAARVSLVVAQTRSQFPDLSGSAIPYETRKLPEESPDAQPEPALRGSGVSVEPGLQKQAPQRLQVALYLDKRTYARGYLEVTPGGGAAERWPIVAYDRRGQPDGTFDFMYVLATAAEQVRYLVLIGGRYEDGDERYVGYEGTLIVPGAGNDLEGWKRAYKLDFGYRLPVVPAHERKVEQAVTLFREIERNVDHLQRLRERIAAAEGDLATLRNTTPEPKQQARHDALLEETQTRLETIQVERDTLLQSTEASIVRYYELRQAISEEYAAFTKSNRYLWVDRAGKQRFYDAWKVVEFHHPRIDELVSTFLTFTDEDGKVLTTRRAAMDVITRNDNWARNPTRTDAKRPSQ